MLFHEMCDEMGIGRYAERIFHSNSHGELFHIFDYQLLYETYEWDGEFKEMFSKWVDECVNTAERTWKRPESIFQHLAYNLFETLEDKEK